MSMTVSARVSGRHRNAHAPQQNLDFGTLARLQLQAQFGRIVPTLTEAVINHPNQKGDLLVREVNSLNGWRWRAQERFTQGNQLLRSLIDDGLLLIRQRTSGGK